MKLVTDRTILIPFNLGMIDVFSGKSNSSQYIHNEEWPENALIEAFPVFEDLLYTNGDDGFNLWLVIEKKTNMIIGSAGYIGRPNSEGDIEIGFGIIPSKREQGFCNESVKALLEWGFTHDIVKNIIAKCDAENTASIKAILKLGFEFICEEGDLWVGRLSKEKCKPV
jgi:RimJ/RimL family protein N-acetyltransferase